MAIVKITRPTILGTMEISLPSASAKKVQSELALLLPKIKKMSHSQRPGFIKRTVDKIVPGMQWSEANTPVGLLVKAFHPSEMIRKVRAGKTVYQYDKAGNLIASYPSVNAAHRATGIADSSICYCANGKYGFKTAGGYKWSYDEVS